ncbi:MAG: BTAD domain-containing putative transcriptional regulator [Cellulomonas sp.]
MQVRTLGMLSIDGIVVPGARLGALARTLLAARGHVVPVGDLVDIIWDDEVPADTRGALQALVSRLRRHGLTVDAAGAGYRADLRDVDVDALTAQDLRAAARAAQARGDHAQVAALAGQGLALWDEPPEPDVEQLHTDLLALHVEASLAVGHPVPDVDTLRCAVDRRRTDEPLTALLMRALAATGREAEALTIYDDLRTELANRFGTDPATVVSHVHLALLRGELGAPAGRPAARAATAPVTLPPALATWRRPTTPLVGREPDVLAIEEKLRASALVTLVAVGGAGKTRLAIEVARRAAERGEAVHAVELAGAREPSEVLPALLAAIGASESTIEGVDPRTRRMLTPTEQLQRGVGTLDGLIVLDNCEHLLDAIADLAMQVAQAAGPRLRVLATSRTPLGVVGETVHTVTTLPDEAALELLESRARAARPSITWDHATSLELCHRLDNLPLALELAGARLRSMPLADVLAGIEHRFELLDNTLRGLPDRHQGLWAMVDWSWALLEPDQQALLRALAVVPAPFTADLAAALGDPAGLAVLVDHSLLTIEELPGGPPRYRMLETVREYGEARLRSDPDPAARDEVMSRLVRWAEDEARRLRSAFIGRGQLAAFRQATAELDTLVAALRWSVDHRRDRESFAIAAALLFLWSLRGLHLEVAVWSRQLMRIDEPGVRRASWALLAADVPDRPHPDDVAVVALITGLTATITADLRTRALGLRFARWVTGLDAELVEHRAAVFARLCLEVPAQDHGDELMAATALISDHDPYLSALGLFLRAGIRENNGDAIEAAAEARAAYALFESIGDHWGMGMAAQAIGQWSDGAGENPEADAWMGYAVHHLELVGAVQDARTLTVARAVKQAVAGSADALAVLEAAIGNTGTSLQERAYARLGLGMVAGVQGRWADAIDQADAALDAARADVRQAPQMVIIIEVAVAILRIRAGLDAEALLGVAAHATLDLPDMPVLGSVALGYAELAATHGEQARAMELWALGTRLSAHLERMFGSVLTFASRAEPDAAAARANALAAAHTLGVPAVVARITELIGRA